ncbi:amino acid deaminase/aldolase [Brevibacterium luteolum]|uniref:Amino acid deaminase/aldolase n=1 Tax=Brevibacterium luteolum TaxID=199591 RepID=A0A6G8KXN5_9MICO|nr:amino acid deaminase/aldolase [Brevibacterium luteolum]QIN29574.1 amino acid deaminase/aldolase [Brevibacterium luteolum]
MVTPDLRRAVAVLNAPFGVIDRDAFDANAAAMTERAAGLPIRVASKSLRTPAAIERALELPGFAGVLTFSLPEALALHARGIRDIVVAYPSVDRAALAALAADPAAAAHITLMVDHPAQLDLIETAATAPEAVVRVCIDIDGSLRVAGLHIGARRSPLHEVSEVLGFVGDIAARDHVRLAGLMCYESQVAGVPNAGANPRQAILRRLQARSIRELTERRTAIVTAVRGEAELEFVNGGGTGSLETSAAEGSLTEVAAGSGLFAPASFDRFAHFRHTPAAYFTAPVVRTPAPDWVTVAGGGWIASGAAGIDRLPAVAWPTGLAISATEGMGEVQTPLTGRGTRQLRIGDHVFFRHAKAGELAEHLDFFHIVADGQLIETWETYRGLGWNFETGMSHPQHTPSR